MSKAILIYGSTTGNTETLAEHVSKGMQSSGVGVTVKRVEEASVREMRDYDAIVLGCSTWGDGELQDDFIPFYEAMRNIDLKTKRAAVFGPGDSGYPQFCKAVELLGERLKACGADIVMEPMKIDGGVESQTAEAERWGAKVAAGVSVAARS
jgi:flavodoxin short chain